MGATVVGDTAPLFIEGSDELTAIDYATPVASAQVKSCILLAGLRAKGTTRVTEPERSRDHTERMLKACGVRLELDGLTVSLEGGQRIHPFEFEVPGDLSSAAFFMVAGAIVPDASVGIAGVGVNPTRTGILDVFQQSGLEVALEAERDSLGEPAADIYVRYTGIGMPFEISSALVPRLLDEIPALAVLATQLDGVSVIQDAEELRLKESDRIETVADGLQAMGAEVEPTRDGMRITGPTRLRGTKIQAGGDHRIAMAFAIAGLVAEGETVIEGAETIATSYPDFERNLWELCGF
jgi:3-phosphoshikimate 1-carboxyvinyltransferase